MPTINTRTTVNHFSITFSGMLSKSKGQVLRVAATFQVLFKLDHDAHQSHADQPETGNVEQSHTDIIEYDMHNISGAAVIASIDFVKLCCQQTAFIAGRGDLKDEIEIITASMFI